MQNARGRDQLPRQVDVAHERAEKLTEPIC
jgi:hypothetical protein